MAPDAKNVRWAPDLQEVVATNSNSNNDNNQGTSSTSDSPMIEVPAPSIVSYCGDPSSTQKTRVQMIPAERNCMSALTHIWDEPQVEVHHASVEERYSARLTCKSFKTWVFTNEHSSEI